MATLPSSIGGEAFRRRTSPDQPINCFSFLSSAIFGNSLINPRSGLQQPLDFSLDLALIVRAPSEMGVGDLAVSIEQINLGNRAAPIFLFEYLASVEHYGIRQFLTLDELRDPVLGLVPGVDCDDPKAAIAVFLVKRLEVRSLRTTGPSPDGPKAEQHHIALVL